MKSFDEHIQASVPPPSTRAVNGHADVYLLARMAFVVEVTYYSVHGQFLSRDKCFQIAWSYIVDELWPLTVSVTPDLSWRTVFLGQGRFAKGSWRRWVGDLQGLVLAQRFSEGDQPRRGKHHDKEAKKIRESADEHLQNLIAAVATKIGAQDNVRLLEALQQLKKELF